MRGVRTCFPTGITGESQKWRCREGMGLIGTWTWILSIGLAKHKGTIEECVGHVYPGSILSLFCGVSPQWIVRVYMNLELVSNLVVPAKHLLIIDCRHTNWMLVLLAYGAMNDPCVFVIFCHFCWLDARCSWNWCMRNWRHVTGLGWGGDVNAAPASRWQPSVGGGGQKGRFAVFLCIT